MLSRRGLFGMLLAPLVAREAKPELLLIYRGVKTGSWSETLPPLVPIVWESAPGVEPGWRVTAPTMRIISRAATAREQANGTDLVFEAWSQRSKQE